MGKWEKIAMLKVNQKRSIISLSIIILLINILTITYYFSKKKNIIQETEITLKQIVEQKREIIYKFFQKHLDELTTTANKIAEQNLNTTGKDATKTDKIPKIPENYIFFSNTRKALISNNKSVPNNMDFSTGPYKITNLGQVLDRVITILTPDISTYEYYPTLSEPNMFAATPVTDSKNILRGVLVNEVNISDLLDSLKKQTINKNIRLIITKLENENSKIIFSFFGGKKRAKDIEEKHPELLSKITSEETIGNIIKSKGTASIIESWDYEPYSTWNIVAFIEIDEALQKLSSIFYLLLILTILSIGVIVYWSIWFINFLYRNYNSKDIIRYSVLFVLLTVIFGSVIGIFFTNYKIYNLYKESYEKTENYTYIQLQSATKQIERNLFNTEFTATFLAEEIKNYDLNEKQIDERVRGILEKRSKYADSITVAYKNDKKIGAPTWIMTSSGVVKYNLADLYDYTQVKAYDMPEANWYMYALANGKYWSLPYTHPISKTKVVTFAIPFNDGVLAYNYKADELGKKLNAFLGESVGTNLIVNHNANIIYQLKDQETSGSLSSAEQNKIIADAIKKEFGRELIREPESGKEFYVWYEPIPIAEWTAVHLALKDEIKAPPIPLRHLNIIFICLITIFLISCFVGLFYTYPISDRTKNILLVLASIVPLIAIMTILYNSRQNKYNERLDAKKITSAAKLTKYLDMIEQRAVQKQLPKPVPVSIGIDIYSIDISADKESIIIAGHLQEQYQKGKTPGIRIPQAKKLELRKMYEQESGNQVTVGWDIYAEITQDLDISKYPFDRPKLEIALEPDAAQESFIFIPNMKAKQFIEQEYQVADFTIKHSYYTYDNMEYSLNSVEENNNSYGLTLEIQLQRNTTNPLMTDMIPLIIIFLTVFLIKLLSDLYLKNSNEMAAYDSLDLKFNIAAAYTALFFSVILMHPRLRGIVQSSNIIYIEYFFFCAYAAIFVFQLMALTPLFTHPKERYFNQITTYLYWPALGVVWLFFTVLTFYNP